MSRKTLLSLGLAGLALIASGCSYSELDNTPAPITIRVSEISGGPLDGFRYNGMPNEKTFSLSALSDWAVNDYYPTDKKEIYFQGRNFEVLSVDAERIILRPIKGEAGK